MSLDERKEAKDREEILDAYNASILIGGFLKIK